MKAIPMKGRLTGKRVSGFVWAGSGSSWTRKENYFQLEHNEVVSAVLGTSAGTFWVRCKGMTCKITLKDSQGHVLGTTILALPGAKKKTSRRTVGSRD
jgi:hypothetical protein